MNNALIVGSALLLLVGAPAAFAQNAPKPSAQASSLPDWRTAPRYTTLNLRAGFQPDPREVTVDAGGSRKATAIRRDCAGWIDFTRPDVDLNYEPGQYPLVISANSAADTTIVINDPAGNWHCNDDLVGLDPGVVFQRPLRGNYNIWVGTLDRGRPQRATVRVSEVLPARPAPQTAPSANLPGPSNQALAPAAPQPPARVAPPPAQTANPPPGTSAPRPPLSPLPEGEALLAYTRRAMGPALAASVPLVPTATPRVLRADTREPNLPMLVIAWAEEAPAVEALRMVASFEHGINGQCQDRRAVADGVQGGVRFSAYTATCPGVGLQLWMIAARDADRIQLLALAAPTANGDAVLARGQMLLQHLGISQASSPALPAQPASAAPRAAAPAPTAPPAQAPADPGTTQVQTVTGLSRDQPFSLSYPDFMEQFTSLDTAIALRHREEDLQVFLTIEPAAAGSNAAAAQARFQDSEVTAAQRRTYPDFVLNGARGLVQLPAGPAFVYQGALTSMAPGRARLRFVQGELYDGGRRYQLAIYVAEDIYESARPLIGFLLANLSPSSARRPCCADPVALP